VRQKIKLWLIGTKRIEFREDLCTGIMSGIVILGIIKINKAFIVFQNLFVYIKHLIFLVKDEQLHRITSYMNFYLNIEWGSCHHAIPSIGPD